MAETSCDQWNLHPCRWDPLSWSSSYVTTCLADVNILLSNSAVWFLSDNLSVAAWPDPSSLQRLCLVRLVTASCVAWVDSVPLWAKRILHLVPRLFNHTIKGFFPAFWLHNQLLYSRKLLKTFANWLKNKIFVEKLLQIAHWCLRQKTPHPNFVKKTLRIATKFVFSLKSLSMQVVYKWLIICFSYQAVQRHKLSKLWFTRLLDARVSPFNYIVDHAIKGQSSKFMLVQESDLSTSVYLLTRHMEAYAEHTSSALLYLTLEALGKHNRYIVHHGYDKNA